MATSTIPAHPYQRRYRRIVWRQRYDGIVTVAYRSGHAIAGISGPWSERYALTWWSEQSSDSSLELFNSLEAAKLAVVERMREQRSSSPIDLQAFFRQVRTSFQPFWLTRLRALFTRSETQRPAQASLQLRRQLMCRDIDLSGIHFDAYC